MRIGPVGFRVGSDWRAPIDQLAALYAGYPTPAVPDATVRLEAGRPWRRWVRPAVHIRGDLELPGALPLPLRHGLLAAEMGMNLQVALGWRRHLLLHASVVARDGRAVMMTGESGSGKSTLAALLMARGWRLLGDEFALLDPATGLLHPFPRAISLKNESIDVVARAVPAGRWGPRLVGTPKGDVRHLMPDAAAVSAMDVPARPVALLFPRHGEAAERRPVPPSEAFVRLTQASTNYVALGERGFRALTNFIGQVPATAVDFTESADAIAAVEAAWTAG